jgi:hypothetical protein
MGEVAAEFLARAAVGGDPAEFERPVRRESLPI